MTTPTEAEATCLEYSNRSNEPRYLNANYRQFGSTEPRTTIIQAFKGLRCIAYAKDGRLFRSVDADQFFEVPLVEQAN